MESISLRTEKKSLEPGGLQKFMLLCGILSTLWYAVVNIIVPFQYPGYDIASLTVSELSAIDTPTRTLWIILMIPFTIFTIAFGCGVWSVGKPNKKLLIVAIVIIVDAVFGAFWPPMHQRQVIAAGGGTMTDTLHLVWAFVHLALMIVMMGFGAAALGKWFRIYTIATFIVFIVFGLLTSQESMGIEAGTPTPYVGIWERINIGAYMMWVVVFAINLLGIEKGYYAKSWFK